jgi:hypothetical protein
MFSVIRNDVGHVHSIKPWYNTKQEITDVFFLNTDNGAVTLKDPLTDKNFYEFDFDNIFWRLWTYVPASKATYKKT